MYNTFFKTTYNLYLYTGKNQKLIKYQFNNVSDIILEIGYERTMRSFSNQEGPWISQKYYSWAEQKYVYEVIPNTMYIRKDGPQLNYISKKKYKKRKHIEYKYNCKHLGKFLREYNVFEDEPKPRFKPKKLYYEDAYSVRKEVKNWKSYRKTQWKE